MLGFFDPQGQSALVRCGHSRATVAETAQKVRAPGSRPGLTDSRQCWRSIARRDRCTTPTAEFVVDAELDDMELAPDLEGFAEAAEAHVDVPVAEVIEVVLGLERPTSPKCLLPSGT